MNVGNGCPLHVQEILLYLAYIAFTSDFRCHTRGICKSGPGTWHLEVQCDIQIIMCSTEAQVVQRHVSPHQDICLYTIQVSSGGEPTKWMRSYQSRALPIPPPALHVDLPPLFVPFSGASLLLYSSFLTEQMPAFLAQQSSQY